MADGFSDEYVPRDIERGCGGKPGMPDFNPIAFGVTADGTSIEKREARAKSGIATADGGEFDEPKPGYAAEYPQNIVFEKNGIVIEVDATHGHERIHIYHPSHTYIEIDAEGNLKIRNAKDRFEFVDRDLKEYVRANMDTVIDGNKTEKVGGTTTIKCPMIMVNCT